MHRGHSCELHAEHALVAIHPAHARQRHLREGHTSLGHCDTGLTVALPGGTAGHLAPRPRSPAQRWGRIRVRGTYIRCQHGVAGRGLVYRHGEAEGACPQAAVLQQWDPLRRDWGSDVGPDKGWEGWAWMGERRRGAHSKAHRSLQGRARPGLAADVVEATDRQGLAGVLARHVLHSHALNQVNKDLGIAGL
ncbi:hypothetical protein Celaphus_00003196 [Cervus elaphus hippelaphus]|uniref:Uncharacterized protein n=1 Tax=Cervus elaphus hippelaphus TaxID=46360 RepID=A0A212D0F6_CEREH|nr:hypothetical protein Celaphus_00003196 [Cervus elaphus hippelaphus]